MSLHKSSKEVGSICLNGRFLTGFAATFASWSQDKKGIQKSCNSCKAQNFSEIYPGFDQSGFK